MVALHLVLSLVCLCPPDAEGSIFATTDGVVAVDGDFRVVPDPQSRGRFVALALHRLPGGAQDRSVLAPGSVVRVTGGVTGPIATPTVTDRSTDWADSGIVFESEQEVPLRFTGYARVRSGAVEVSMSPKGLAEAVVERHAGGLELSGAGAKNTKVRLFLTDRARLLVVDPRDGGTMLDAIAGDRDFAAAFDASKRAQSARLDELSGRLKSVARTKPAPDFADRDELRLYQTGAYLQYAHAEEILDSTIRPQTPIEKARNSAALVLLGKTHFAEGRTNVDLAITATRNRNGARELRKRGLPPKSLFPEQEVIVREIMAMLQAAGRSGSQEEQQSLAEAAGRVVDRIDGFQADTRRWRDEMNATAAELLAVGMSEVEVKNLTEAAGHDDAPPPDAGGDPASTPAEGTSPR